MSTPKRWYQLSMSQLLAATAVVAVFVVNNSSIKPASPPASAGTLKYIVHFDDTPLAVRSLKAGWPIPYWHARGTTSEGRAYLAAYPTYRIWALAANSVMCAAAVAVTAALVDRLTRKPKP